MGSMLPLLLAPLLLLQQLPVASIVLFIAYIPEVRCNQYIGGSIGAVFDKAKELACHALEGSSGAKMVGCSEKHEDTVSANLYRRAHEKLRMLAEQTKSAVIYLIHVADKNDDETRIEAHNIFHNMQQKLENAIEHAYAAANKMPSEQMVAAREKSYEIYKDAMEELIDAAEKAELTISNMKHLIRKHSPPRTETEIAKEKAAEEAKKREARHGSVEKKGNTAIHSLDNRAKSNDNVASENTNGISDVEGSKEAEKKALNSIPDFSRPIAVATAADLMSSALNSVQKEIKNNNENDGTSLQETEEAFQEASDDPKEVLLNAKEASLKLETKRSVNPEYMDSKYEAIPTTTSLQSNIMNVIKQTWKKIVNTVHQTISTLLGINDTRDESMNSTENRDWEAGVDEREKARVIKPANRKGHGQ